MSVDEETARVFVANGLTSVIVETNFCSEIDCRQA
ncbi:Uncharacterised protein [Mycolicibacterium vanbaalenii]|uniref:Uncharacterized protein n=1 Tax=Mycolicibacterium vanbaalenii TaxID=110539 RepID=A0A5S9R6S7_MYCVN|nr:Uncharacterised protein [Mycolicibacterium vanbaalenii]